MSRKAIYDIILLSGEDRPDLYSIHKLNPENPREIIAEIYSAPINYHVGNGFYSACDLTILPEKNWEFEYIVRKTNFTSYFNDSTDPDNPTLASFEIINSKGVSRWINYKMYGASPSMGVPTENKILYPECFDGIDLEYVVDTWRLKENIIIKHPIDNYSYSFTLKLDGTILSPQLDGSILFLDVDTQEILWRIEAPYAFDSEGRETHNLSYSMTKHVIENVEYTSITLELHDSNFIENATFPITMDPTTSFSSYPKDTRIAKSGASYPPTTNYELGQNTNQMMAEKQYNITNALFYTYMALLKFDSSSVPDLAVVSAANLILQVTTVNNQSRYVKCDYSSFSYPATYADFIEAGTGTAFSRVLSSFTGGSQNTIPLSNVNNINKTGYTDFKVALDAGTPSYSGVVYTFAFYSYFYGGETIPKLSVVYNTPPTSPVILTPNGGEIYDKTCNITWTPSTDPDGDAITYEIDYSINNGGSYTNITTGATGSSYSWDCTLVAASVQCLIRIRAKDSNGAYSAYDYSNAVFTISHGFGGKIVGIKTNKVIGLTAKKIMGT